MPPFSKWHKRYYFYFKQFPRREVPLIFLTNGRPGYVINHWILDLVDLKIPPSRLDLYIRSICGLYDICMARYGQAPMSTESQQRLLADYIEARLLGTDCYCTNKTNTEYDYLRTLGLHWKPTDEQNVKQNLLAIDKFDRWQSTFHGAPRINPSEKVFLNTYEIYSKWRAREKWDPFFHLFNTHSRTKEDFKIKVASEEHKRASGGARWAKRRKAKAFPLYLFIELVEACTNPRDKMLVLLMSGASLRRAEPLHLFSQDIEGYDQFGQARVRLEDPEFGKAEWKEGARRCSGTRKEYFKRVWANDCLSEGHPLRNLMPRTMYGKRNERMHAGFKGMTFSESDISDRFIRPFDEAAKKSRPLFRGDGSRLEGTADNRPYDVYHAWWIDPRVGAYFYECYQEYKRQYILTNPFTGEQNPSGWPYHPWLFINFESPKTYGYPLSYTALKTIWARLLERLTKRVQCEGLLEGLGWHSLRHFFGFYCANLLKLDLETTQVLMHHSSISSTEVYYSLSTATIKETITRAILKHKNIKEGTDVLNDLKLPTIKFPDHWTNQIFKQSRLNYLLEHME